MWVMRQRLVNVRGLRYFQRPFSGVGSGEAEMFLERIGNVEIGFVSLEI